MYGVDNILSLNDLVIMICEVDCLNVFDFDNDCDFDIVDFVEF